MFNVIIHAARNNLCRCLPRHPARSGKVLSRASIFQFLRLRQLGSGRREDLNAIVLIGIVGGGNHDAGGKTRGGGSETQRPGW